MRTTPEASHVAREIDRQNPWYVGSQFEWAEQPGVRRIYRGRERFFKSCITRVQDRLRRPVRVLDAGCGDGYWLHRMDGWPGVHLTGIDYNPLRVERARQVAPRARIIDGDLTDRVLNGMFDVILCSQVIEHVKDDGALLRTLCGWLEPHGRLVLGTPNEGSPRHQRALQARGPHFVTDHVHFYTEPHITELIHRAGLIVERTYREVFFVGHDPLYYWLTARSAGFALLSALAWLWPAECSDFYFECRHS